jgi:hypothetical protein
MAGYRRSGAGRIHGERVVHVGVAVAVGCGGGKPLSHGCLVSGGWQEEKCCAPPRWEKKHTRSPHIHSPHVDLIAQQLLGWHLPARSARLTQLAADRPTRPAVLATRDIFTHSCAYFSVAAISNKFKLAPSRNEPAFLTTHPLPRRFSDGSAAFKSYCCAGNRRDRASVCTSHSPRY